LESDLGINWILERHLSATKATGRFLAGALMGVEKFKLLALAFKPILCPYKECDFHFMSFFKLFAAFLSQPFHSRRTPSVGT